MGFWGTTFKVAKNTGLVIASAIEQSANETREIKTRHEECSDDELIKIVYKTGLFAKSSKEKSLAFAELRKRGLDEAEIKSRGKEYR